MSAEITPQWNQCLAIIRDNIDEQAYDKWFEPIKPLKYVDNTLTIEVPSPFFPELLEQNFAKLIRYTLNKVYGENGEFPNKLYHSQYMNAIAYFKMERDRYLESLK